MEQFDPELMYFIIQQTVLNAIESLESRGTKIINNNKKQC